MTEKDADYVPETQQRHCNTGLLKREIEQQKTRKETPRKTKTDFSVTAQTQLEFDEVKNVNAINTEGQEETDDEGNFSNSSTIYTMKEKRSKKSFNKHCRGSKHFYPELKFFYTISDESASKETLKWLNSVLQRKECIIKNSHEILNGKHFFSEKNRKILPCPF